jgi:Holliday junction resolvasome RuvABC ATP-dependent DNA helicase subunit
MCVKPPPSQILHRIRPTILQVLEQLDTQIGWESVKKAIGAIITAMEANYDREMSGKMPLDIPLNCLMLGNPGTGKTTCAHFYGSLLKATGFLSNGTVVSKTASDFIADVVGGSQVKTKAILSSPARIWACVGNTAK